jgi:hypothetical protein
MGIPGAVVFLNRRDEKKIIEIKNRRDFHFTQGVPPSLYTGGYPLFQTSF